MKYIISESKIKNFIFEYLDDYNFHILSDDDGNIYIYESKYNFNNEDFVIIGYSIKTNNIFIKDKLVDEVSRIFGLEPDYTMSIISDWVVKKFNLDNPEYFSDMYFG